MAKTSKDYPIDDDLRLAARIEEGLPVSDVVAFGRTANFTADELARLIRIPSRTYSRRLAAKSRLKADEGERAVRLMRVYDRAKKVFRSHENTREWLNSHLRALGGRTPLELARTEPGAREVEAVLERIVEGVYS